MVIVWQEQTGDWHQQEVRLSLHDNPRDACLSKNSLASFYVIRILKLVLRVITL